MKRIRKLMDCNLILKNRTYTKKYKICVQDKKRRKPYNKHIKMNIKLLDLIHGNVCESSTPPTR